MQLLDGVETGAFEQAPNQDASTNNSAAVPVHGDPDFGRNDTWGKFSKHTFHEHVEVDQSAGLQWTVIVWDHQRSRVRLINRIVSKCQARSLWVAGLSDIDGVQHSFRCCTALVALGACPTENTLGLEVIRRLKNLGFKVIAYEEGSHAWTLGVRCRALLAGALCLLDSGEVEFAEGLQCALMDVFQEKTRARNEKERLKVPV
jgi:hypothetical protein